MAKEKCECGKLAVWSYMPGKGKYCDDCISSPDDMGCSCNFNYSHGEYAEQPEGIEGKDWRWVTHEGNDYWRKMTKEDGIWQSLDDRGRPHPCAEYMYDEEGFDKLTLWDHIAFPIRMKYFETKWAIKRWWRKHIIDEAPDNTNL